MPLVHGAGRNTQRTCSYSGYLHPDFETAKPSLSKEVVQEYEKKLDHLKEREADVEKVYCAEATCTKYIPPGDRGKEVAKCPHCKAETCCHCKKLAHFGDCGDGDQDQGDMPSLF